MEQNIEVEFKPGDIIQDYSDPFVKIVFQSQKGRRCDHCFKGGFNLSRCSRCQLMYYCNKDCQLKDWKESHSVECKSDFFKKPVLNVFQSPDFKPQMYRLFAVLKLHPKRVEKKYPMYDGKDRCFDDLISHQAALKKNVPLISVCEEMAKELGAEGSLVDVDYLLRLAGVWKTNSFPILNETETATIGTAIFIEPSFFDHSCKPNAVVNTQSCRMQIRAIAPIAKGEKPFITYLAGHKTKQERATLLRQRYNFVCKCERCVLEETENLIDYGKLKNLIDLSYSQYNWKEYLKTHDEILVLMRKLYYEYDERIANRYFLTVQEASQLGAPKDVIRKLAKTTQEHLLITFGVNSPDYQKCTQLKSFF